MGGWIAVWAASGMDQEAANHPFGGLAAQRGAVVKSRDNPCSINQNIVIDSQTRTVLRCPSGGGRSAIHLCRIGHKCFPRSLIEKRFRTGRLPRLAGIPIL